VEGKLHLTLRNPLDGDQTATSGVRVASLLGAPDPPPVARVVRAQVKMVPPPPPPPPVSRIYTVEAIRAAKRSEEVVK
jgi:hypothetical protein